MRLIAKGWYLKSIILVITTALTASAGVLENLDNELTSLVAKAEPFLVTIEAQCRGCDRVYVGSGVLVDSDGYIVTTTSVVGAADKARVSFKNGAEYDAQIVGKDYNTGLALLEIEPLSKPTPILGNSFDIKEGSWIIIIGNSYEMPNAVSLGVYSGMTDEGFLQLSVQTGPGSSGSAVFNTRGEIIGIIVAQASETVSLNLPLAADSGRINKASSGTKASPPKSIPIGVEMPTSGTSLAVPVDKLQKTIDQLRENGEVKHGLLGIRQKALSVELKKQHGLDGGIEVTDVVGGSPAEKAGIMKGDIIYKVDNEDIKGTGHLYSIVRSHQPKDKVKFETIHNTERLTKIVVLDEAPNEGYFGFIQNSVRPEDSRYIDQNLAAIRDKLADQIESATDNIVKIDRAELDKYLTAVDKRMTELEGQVNELSTKFNELYKKFEDK